MLPILFLVVLHFTSIAQLFVRNTIAKPVLDVPNDLRAPYFAASIRKRGAPSLSILLMIVSVVASTYLKFDFFCASTDCVPKSAIASVKIASLITLFIVFRC